MVKRFAAVSGVPAALLAFASMVGVSGWFWWTATHRPGINFLPSRAPAHWIVYPSAPQGKLHLRVELSTVFESEIVLDHAPPQATAWVAGFHRYSLKINGEPCSGQAQSAKSWKLPDRLDVSTSLRRGTNRIQVTVYNADGPPALWFLLEAGGRLLISDASWRASCAGATWRAAHLASKPVASLEGNAIHGGAQPWASLTTRWSSLVVFGVLSAMAYWLANRWRSVPGAGRLAANPRGMQLVSFLPLAAVVAAWIALFANNLGVLPTQAGYDSTGHMAYIAYVQEQGTLPVANEGWEMFQPPLYYLLGAGLLGLLGLSASTGYGVMALRIMGLCIGVAHLLTVWACLRILFPKQIEKARWGVLLAGCLPPVLYLSQYVTNESLAAALVSGCVWLCLRLLQSERFSWKLCVALGACLGAALLAKSTALLALPPVVLALFWKSMRPAAMPGQTLALTEPHAASRPWRLASCAGQVALILATCLIVCGWHYIRVWSRFGDPLIGVWDPRTGFSWWQDTGYRTAGFYLRFGDALSQPWFSALKSFWDGIYATLWGDGLLGGSADFILPPPWNYDLMAIGYRLALVPTAALLAGAVLAARQFFLETSPEWVLILGLGFLMGFGVVHISLVAAYYCSVKAFYGLSALVPLCVFGVLGLGWLIDARPKLRPVVCVLMGVWALNTFVSFWISHYSSAALLARARSVLRSGHAPEIAGVLQERLRLEPQNWEVRWLLADVLNVLGRVDEARLDAEQVVREQSRFAGGHLTLGLVLAHQAQFEAAIEQFRQALNLAPGYTVAYEHLASSLVEQGRCEEAITVAREGLAQDPFSPSLRLALGACLVSPAGASEAIMQLQLASALGSTDSRLHFNLAAAFALQHQMAQAIDQYQQILADEPDFWEALNNLAWLRATAGAPEFRSGGQAVSLAERACELTEYRLAIPLGTLAAAYAEAGNFEQAVQMAAKARELALRDGQPELARRNQQLLDQFNAKQPWREE